MKNIARRAWVVCPWKQCSFWRRWYYHTLSYAGDNTYLNLQEMLEIDQELCMMEAFANLGSGKKCRCLPTARFNANIQILDSFTIQRSISRLQLRFISRYCSTAKDPVLKCNLFEKNSFGLWPGRVLGGACTVTHRLSNHNPCTFKELGEFALTCFRRYIGPGGRNQIQNV